MAWLGLTGHVSIVRKLLATSSSTFFKTQESIHFLFGKVVLSIQQQKWYRVS